MALLSIKNLTKNFGGLCANSNISMEIDDGELVGLIGPNGAGKTTLFNMLTGVYEPSEGTIDFVRDGKEVRLNGKKPYVVTALGLARTFQNIRLFQNLSVIDNVKIAMNKDVKCGVVASILRFPMFFKEEERIEKEALELLDILHLADKKDELACNLPYGEQRRLEIARALATRPKLLFLDEPAAGMNPQETAELTQLIRRIKDEFHISVLLIEHDMSLVMNLCERIYVLDYGKCIASGTPAEIQTNKRVIEAYLGEEV
ncbi:MAG: ABC transporter ATP-binding protein [Erysipelotrichaceae bacterium]|jgi:branched-chain amino acid transport system ATP-binding protein|nr:ABC transporter ATP-binding protein [Erysipelotrichaceae bacterium]